MDFVDERAMPNYIDSLGNEVADHQCFNFWPEQVTQPGESSSNIMKMEKKLSIVQRIGHKFCLKDLDSGSKTHTLDYRRRFTAAGSVINNASP